MLVVLTESTGLFVSTATFIPKPTNLVVTFVDYKTEIRLDSIAGSNVVDLILSSHGELEVGAGCER